ncbi:hypothetical protein BJV78DRAFT_393474 [Lactifluus subvellereus]|nr:hypothetical protein BJV78DRAFT_393474 [Lactifluus subvellereus]
MSMLPVYRLPYTAARSTPTTTPSFETCLGTLRLAEPAHGGELGHPVVGVVGPYAIDPATSERNGSITHDRKTRSPTHEWSSLNEFHAWRMNEERDHCIELLGGRSYPSVTRLYRETRTYVCSRQGTGGKPKYTKKYKDRIRARSNKRTGCRCKVIIKTYHHVSTVLGWYKSGHDHATGMANLMYTRIRDSTRAYVLGLLRTGMGTREVVRNMWLTYRTVHLTCPPVDACAREVQ